MPLRYEDLDPTTRRYSLDEFQYDVQRERFGAPDRLRRIHAAEYPKLLEKALKYYDDLWLEQQLEGKLVDFEIRRTPSGGRTSARLPENAARVLAEGIFNYYYMRGLCARAAAEGVRDVEVYRARLSIEPREESSHLEGNRIPALALLDQLRHGAPDAALLGKHGSGMTVRLASEPAHVRSR